jgi:hypothetical protein
VGTGQGAGLDAGPGVGAGYGAGLDAGPGAGAGYGAGLGAEPGAGAGYGAGLGAEPGAGASSGYGASQDPGPGQPASYGAALDSIAGDFLDGIRANSAGGSDGPAPGPASPPALASAYAPSEYYRRQFEKIEGGEEGDFNLPVLFLGPFIALYRKSDFFLRCYLPPLIAFLLALWLTPLVVSLIRLSRSGDRREFGTVFVVVFCGILIWGLRSIIRGAKSFNAHYYRQVLAVANASWSEDEKHARLRASLLRPIILLICLVIAFWIAGAALSSPTTGQSGSGVGRAESGGGGHNSDNDYWRDDGYWNDDGYWDDDDSDWYDDDYWDDDDGGYYEGVLGDTLENVFFAFSVDDAYLTNRFEGETPAAGMVFLVTEITVTNVLDEIIPMYSDDFQAQWGEGDEDFGYPIPKFHPSQMEDEYGLVAADTITGLCVYEVPRPEARQEYSISYMELYDDGYEGDVFFIFFDLAPPAAVVI